MSWTSKVWNWVNQPIPSEQRAVTSFDVFGNSDQGVKTVSGARVSEDTAFKYSVAYSAMTLIADAVSSLPPQAQKKSEDETLEPTRLPDWIRKPHPEQSRFDVWNQIMLSVLAWGNGYARIIRRPSDGVIVALDPLDPDSVTVEWDPIRPLRRRYKIDHASEWLTSYEILHVQGPTLPGHAAGLSVIAQSREAIGLGLTLEEFGARYFGQGSQAKIVIEMPQKIDTADEAARIVKTFERFHKGRGNWHRPAIVSLPRLA
jgi:HK97 family phage portal protein